MKFPAALVVTLTVAEFPLTVVTVCVEPPSILYSNVYGGTEEAPVKVTAGGDEFWQTVAEPETEAVGE